MGMQAIFFRPAARSRLFIFRFLRRRGYPAAVRSRNHLFRVKPFRAHASLAIFKFRILLFTISSNVHP